MPKKIDTTIKMDVAHLIEFMGTSSVQLAKNFMRLFSFADMLFPFAAAKFHERQLTSGWTKKFKIIPMNDAISSRERQDARRTQIASYTYSIIQSCRPV